MRTISKIRTSVVVLVTVALAHVCSAMDGINLDLDKRTHIRVLTAHDKVVATDRDDNVRYGVAKAFEAHILRAESLRLIPLEGGLLAHQFVLISHEFSRPGSMGGGYCGGGYEDFLLLIELSGRNLTLLDERILQSCLKSIDLGVDDPTTALTQHQGFYTFRWVGDDQERKLSVRESRFHIDVIP